MEGDTMNITEKLEEQFFNYLDENAIQYTEFDNYGPHGHLEYVIEPFNSMSHREMCEYMDMPEWVIDWTMDLIESEAK